MLQNQTGALLPILDNFVVPQIIFGLEYNNFFNVLVTCFNGSPT
jgi:hypothetical protein